MSQYSAGAAFRKAVQEESPLQVVGAINANHALLAKRGGFRAFYLSGGGVAAGSLGLPDLGISNDRRVGYFPGEYNRNVVLWRVANCTGGAVPAGCHSR